jgi:hypothetical protein
MGTSDSNVTELYPGELAGWQNAILFLVQFIVAPAKFCILELRALLV